MKISLNYDETDIKYTLLDDIFNIIDSRKVIQIFARNNVKNTTMMKKCLKILLTSIFFTCNVSDVVYEANRTENNAKFLGLTDGIPSKDQVYEYLSRYDSSQYTNIVNSILKLNNRARGNSKKTFIVDASCVAHDINTARKYIPEEKLENISGKWAFSKNKGYYIGYTVTIVLDSETLCPVSILIHFGSPNDARIFDEILEELCRRRLIRNGDILICDRGYYSYENYIIGIIKYKIVPFIFPKSPFKIKKLDGDLSYPLDIYKKPKELEKAKQLFNNLKKELFKKLEEWKEYKSVRGIIEDFFKVTKQAFGMDKIHAYTEESIKRNILFTVLVTYLTIKDKFTSKTKLQQLAEGKLEEPPTSKNKKKSEKEETKPKEEKSVLQTLDNYKLFKFKKEIITTLEYFS